MERPLAGPDAAAESDPGIGTVRTKLPSRLEIGFTNRAGSILEGLLASDYAPAASESEEQSLAQAKSVVRNRTAAGIEIQGTADTGRSKR